MKLPEVVLLPDVLFTNVPFVEQLKEVPLVVEESVEVVESVAAYQ